MDIFASNYRVDIIETLIKSSCHFHCLCLPQETCDRSNLLSCKNFATVRTLLLCASPNSYFLPKEIVFIFLIFRCSESLEPTTFITSSYVIRSICNACYIVCIFLTKFLKMKSKFYAAL